MKNFLSAIALGASLLAPISTGLAQQGYEFEVYDTHLTKPGNSELELNVNFVTTGPKQINAELFPTHHMVRSSLELGTGLTEWLEASVYFLAARRQGASPQYVGNRLRLTAAAPPSWTLPVEVGLTQEIGYARPGFAEHRWIYELSPMIGKSWGSLDIVVNPAFERDLSGGPAHPVEFEPRGKIGYGFCDEGSVSLEYYSSLGPTSRFDPRSEQKHQLFVALEKDILGEWEVSLSVGRGLTASSDRTVIASRMEYRFGKQP